MYDLSNDKRDTVHKSEYIAIGSDELKTALLLRKHKLNITVNDLLTENIEALRELAK